MTAWVFDGTLLPTGSAGRVIVGHGDHAELPGRFAVAGLVDAHCHLTVAVDDDGPYLGPPALAGERLASLATGGVTAVRDVGGDRVVTLRLNAELRHGLPRVIASGRFLSAPGRYFPRMYDPVEPDDLIAASEAELDAGATWLKLVADFPRMVDGKSLPNSTETTYDLELIGTLIEAAHRRGARVAAHTNSPAVSDLIRLGVDSVEHGRAITADDIVALGARGGAWTPTMSVSVIAPHGAPEFVQQMAAKTSSHHRELLPLAVASGVHVLAGTDVAGTMPDEVAHLANHGLTPVQAIGAATTTAHDYLGIDASDDLVTYQHDPRDDPAELARPAAVVIRGTRVA